MKTIVNSIVIIKNKLFKLKSSNNYNSVNVDINELNVEFENLTGK